jgi:hypothetical protein
MSKKIDARSTGSGFGVVIHESKRARHADCGWHH